MIIVDVCFGCTAANSVAKLRQQNDSASAHPLVPVSFTLM